MNFVVVVADSLRADRLSGAGYGRATSPFLDRLAERGVAFEQAVTPVAPTRPSVATLLSGQHPLTHGIVGKRWPRRPARGMASLPEALETAGWDTLAVDSLAERRCSPWLRRGFRTRIALGADGSWPDAPQFNAAIRGWLRRRGRAPFFLFVRYGDTHTPYRPHRRYRHLFYEGDPTQRNVGSLQSFWDHPHRDYFVDAWERPLREQWPGARGPRIEDVDFFRAMYDSCVRAVDDGVRQLVELLEWMRALDETLFVVTADHGESLGEHGVYFGHVGLHETVARVPCIVAGPGASAAGRRVAATVETTDLAPTLLELAGVRANGRQDGRSLVPWLQGDTPPWPQAPRLACEATYRASWSLRTTVDRAGARGVPHKVIVPRTAGVAPGAPTSTLAAEIYDLRADPGETHDLAASEPALRDALVRELESTLVMELSARGLAGDPLVAALSHVHEQAQRKSAWRRAHRALRHALKRARSAGRAVRSAQLGAGHA